MSADASAATNRMRLRLVLLSSSALLLLMALAAFAVAGAQWAIAPFALGALCGIVALGRMTSKSFIALREDVAEFLGSAQPRVESAGAAGVGAAQVAAQPEATVVSAPEHAPSSLACAACGTLNPANYRFCMECGRALMTPPAQVAAQPEAPVVSAPAHAPSGLACAACGMLNPANYRFCMECGRALTTPPAQVAAQPEAAVVSTRAAPLSILGASERQAGSAVLIAGLMSAAFSLYMFPQGPPNTLAWWSYCLSMILTLGAIPAFEGGWSALFARFRHGYRASFEPRALLPWLALCAILLLALAIRLYNLDGFPPGLWFDEAYNLASAEQIAADPGSLPIYVAYTDLPSFFLMPISVVIKLAGISITTGRLVAVVFGLAGIVAMFLMVRHMLGAAMGLVAAFLTTVMRWDIIWSRTGMHGITAPFFAALTVWLTYRAIQSGRRTDFAVAGAALGLGMWYYAAYRLFPLVIAFVLIHGLVTAARARRRLMLNIGIMAFFAALVTLPLAQFVVSHPDEFLMRTEATSVFTHANEGETGRVIRESLIRHLRMFHIEGDPNGRHNIPGAPMLDIFSGLLMLLGLAVAVARWRNAAFIVLPIWIFIMIMPGVLTVPWEAPQSLRSITVIPAVIALATIGISFIWKVGSSVQVSAFRLGTAVFIAVLLAAIAYTNIEAYFGEQANNPEVYAAYTTDETLITEDLAKQAERGYSPMVSRQFKDSIMASLFDRRFPRQTIAAPVTIPLDPALVWRGAAIYLEPRESGFYDTLKAYYPSADFHEIRPPFGGDILYYSAYISREELEAAQGLLERRTFPDGETVESIRKTTESALMLEADADDAPFDIEWEGTLHITHPGEYVLMLESDSPATVALDGVVILSEERTHVTIEPSVGLHSIEVRAHVKDTQGVLRLLWKPPPTPPKEVEPPPLAKDAAEHALEPIPERNLYHGDVRPVGLSGRFFKGAENGSQIAGHTPEAMQITSSVGSAFWYHPVLKNPHFAVWDGALNVPASGTYRFRFGNVHGALKVVVGGDTVIDTRANRESKVELVEGRHQIRLEYLSSVGSPWFEVLWTPPGEPETRIGPEYLLPAREYMFRVVEEK